MPRDRATVGVPGHGGHTTGDDRQAHGGRERVSIQVTAVPALWPGHVCSPGDSGQAEDVGACPVGQVGTGNGGVHGLWVIASRSAVMMSTRCLAAVEM